jgi:hypothetical protein
MVNSLIFTNVFCKHNFLLILTFMKKLVLLFVAVVAITATSYAQGVSFGVKAGLNVANQKWDVPGFSLSPDARLGFHVGGFATIMFSENFGIQPELSFSTAGFKIEEGGEKYVERWNYITLPVMVRYQPIEILNLHAGPQLGFLAGAKAEFDGESEDIEDTKGFELGLGAGIGVDLPMGLGFNARYVLGLTNIYDVGDADATIKNNVFQISVSYRFGGK